MSTATPNWVIRERAVVPEQLTAMLRIAANKTKTHYYQPGYPSH